MDRVLADNEEFRQVIAQRDAENAEFRRIIDQRNRVIDQRDADNEEFRRKISESNDEVLQIIEENVGRFAGPVRMYQTRSLLELFRLYLAKRYNITLHRGKINAELRSLLDNPEVPPEIRDLIPLVMTDRPSLFRTISEDHVHAPRSTDDLAGFVMATPERELRNQLIQIFRLVTGFDPGDVAFGTTPTAEDDPAK